jgi:diguanylate cyclase (GGDEF)-like protein
VSVLLLDLSRFKVINDRLGHAAGDELLRQVAARLAALPPPVRLAARLGGDEFVLTVHGGRRAATVAAHAAHDAIAGASFDLDGSAVTVTASVGAAPWRAGLDPATLLHQADQAMYTAKTTGSGLHVHDQPVPVPPQWDADRPGVRIRDQR